METRIHAYNQNMLDNDKTPQEVAISDGGRSKAGRKAIHVIPRLTLRHSVE
jgi:hypothetical protein